jgi:hypothetical protein
MDRARAAVMVTPDRLAPGMRANIWATPIRNAPL